MFHDIHFLDAEIFLSPSEISEESVNLIVCILIAGHELTESQRKWYRWDQEGHDTRIQKATINKFYILNLPYMAIIITIKKS